MKNRRRYFTMLTVILSLGIFAVAGCLLAAENDQAIKEGQKAMMEGAKQMMDGNKKIMATVAKKGMKDAEVTAAEKMMADGYDMMVKGESMMTGNQAEGREMMKHGAKMMLDAEKATTAAVEKKGLTKVCAIDFTECHAGEQKIEKGALDWYFGAPGL